MDRRPAMIELYDYELSSDSYKARLLLSMLDVTYVPRLVEVYPAGEHRSDWFLALSPQAELPVLVDGSAIVSAPQRVLIHIARTYDAAGTWFPRDDERRCAEISTWLSFADALAQTCGAARLHDAMLQHDIDVVTCRSGALDRLRELDEHLWFGEQEGRAWLCSGPAPTIADVACFPDVMLAAEGGIALDDFGAIRRWGDRVRALAGFIAMPGIFPR